MVPVDRALEQLTQKAKILSEKTEDLNALISGINKRLNVANVGVSYWMDSQWFGADETPVRPDNEEEDDPLLESDAWIVGYARVGDSWQLAAQKVLIKEDVDGYSGRHWSVHHALSDPMPLLKAPRAIRVEAAPHIETLLEKLSEKVQQHIDSIEKAKKATEE